MASKTVYAPPMVFGPWEKLFSHIGDPNTYTITASPQGDTAITGEVRYFGVDGRQHVTAIIRQVTINVGNCVCNVDVRFRGVPTGSYVDVEW